MAVNSSVKPGDRVIVIGPGTIGILCAAVARICGAEVAVVGLESDKLRLISQNNMVVKPSSETPQNGRKTGTD